MAFNNDSLQIAIGVILIFLGLSFGYKCIRACFQGRLTYWHGFLPITVISPLLVHLPAGKNSLVRSVNRWWVHVIFGPIFFFLSIGFLAAGADRLGLPGSESINYLMTLGHRPGVPAAITYDSKSGYSFPFVTRAAKAIIKVFNTPLMPEEK